MQTSDAYIFRLPDELLVRILTFAAPLSERRGLALTERPGARAIVRVCQRFYQIAHPLLYECIYSAYRTQFVPPSDRVNALHRSLSENPSLRPYCRTLHVHTPDSGSGQNPGLWRTATDIISWLTNVHDFCVHGGFSAWPEEVWKFLDTVAKSMPKIVQLCLSREGFNLSLERLYKIHEFSNLELLCIFGVTSTSVNPDGQTDQETEAGRGRFKTLDLGEFYDVPQSMERLLRWPRELHHFSFYDTDSSQNEFTLAEFGHILAPHKATLQSIQLKSLMSRRKTCIDVSDFSSLHSITIPAHDLECTPTEAASKILAPQLASFTWSFLLVGQTGVSFNAFDEVRAAWLKGFIACAVERKSALRSVHVDFQPYEWVPREWQEGDDISFEYPWDRMDEIAAEFAPRGITLTYAKPPRSKEEMRQDIEEFHEENRRWSAMSGS